MTRIGGEGASGAGAEPPLLRRRSSVYLAVGLVLAPALAADDEALLAFEEGRFEAEGEGVWIRGRIATTLPDGGLVHVYVRYGGGTIPTLRQRFRVREGAVDFELGPTTRRVLSGVYTVSALYERERQPRAYWKILETAGVAAPERFEAARDVVAGQAELTPEEREAIDEDYRAIHDGTSVLLEEALAFRDAAEEDFDPEKYAVWKSGLTGRIRDMGRRYETLLDTYLALPEPGLALSMGAIFQHLSYIVAEASRGPRPPKTDPESEHEDLTVDDRIHHVRQVLRGLAIHLGKAEVDDAGAFAALRKELAGLLDELEAKAKEALDEPARTAWFETWSPRGASLSTGLVVAESNERLLVEFRRLRRDVLAAAEAYRETGTLPDLAEVRRRVEAE